MPRCGADGFPLRREGRSAFPRGQSARRPPPVALGPADPRRPPRDRLRDPDRPHSRYRAGSLRAQPRQANSAEARLMTGSAGFIPVVHAATESRPDEIDTITAARSVAEAVARLGYATEIMGLDPDLAGLEALPARRPLLVFNLAHAVAGDCRLAPMVPARLDAVDFPIPAPGPALRS